MKVDVRDKLIMAATLTPASLHESQVLAALIKLFDKVLYADSAYTGAPIRAMLKEREVEGRINEQGTRSAPLSEEQKHSNKEKSRVRVRVEHVFAQLTVSMKALVQRCIGRKRNAACMMLSNLTYNLLRFEQIKRLDQGNAAGVHWPCLHKRRKQAHNDALPLPAGFAMSTRSNPMLG